jgi:hypothetical protein
LPDGVTNAWQPRSPGLQVLKGRLRG